MECGIKKWACFILLFNLVLGSACAKSEFTEYQVLQGDRINRKEVLVPQSEALYSLGYIGNDQPKAKTKDLTSVIDSNHYAAMVLFSQVNALPYEDGQISIEAQEMLASGKSLKKCPIAVPGYKPIQFSEACNDIKNFKTASSVYDYFEIKQIEKIERNRYRLICSCQNGKLEDAEIQIRYQMPDDYPELLKGDMVFFLGSFYSYDKVNKAYTLQADLIVCGEAQR